MNDPSEISSKSVAGASGSTARPRSIPSLGGAALLFVIGASSVFRFSHDVRAVDVLGLSGGGAACGAALFGIIFALLARSRE